MKKQLLFLLLFLGFIGSASALDNHSKKELPPCEGDYWTHCFGEYSTNEGTSTGEWLNDRLNGKGSIVWSDGSSYFGEFLDGDFHGLGTYDWGDGEKYVGEWLEGRFQGLGQYMWADGTMEMGIFYNDELVKKLTAESFAKEAIRLEIPMDFFNDSDNTEKKEAEAITELPPCEGDHWTNCYGIYTSEWTEGHRFEGEFLDGSFFYGIYTWPDGRTYEGQWHDQHRYGLGIARHPGGSIEKMGFWEKGNLVSRIPEWRDLFEGKPPKIARELICQSDNRENCYGTLLERGQYIYQGKFVNNKKHDIGNIVYADRSKYSGEWSEDKFHGQGTYKWGDGEKYVGGWLEGKFHGQGTLTTAEGDEFTGDWVEDKKQGQGTYKWANGETYIGEWLENEKHGLGIMYYADGSVYRGEWEYGKLNEELTPSSFENRKKLLDRGIEIPGTDFITYLEPCLDEEIFDDYFNAYVIPEAILKNVVEKGGRVRVSKENDWRIDKEVYVLYGDLHTIWDNCYGEFNFGYRDYDGEWQAGRFNGKGVLKYDSGEIYTGEFKNDQIHGQGTFVQTIQHYDNENERAYKKSFEGEYLNGKEHKGTMIYTDGSKYEGEWENGKFHGQGKHTLNDGGYYEGGWDKGLRHGWGKFVHSGDGGITEGEFVYGEPPGCNPYREAIKIYGSFGQGINPEYFIDEILAEAWAKCLDEWEDEDPNPPPKLDDPSVLQPVDPG